LCLIIDNACAVIERNYNFVVIHQINRLNAHSNPPAWVGWMQHWSHLMALFVTDSFVQLVEACSPHIRSGLAQSSASAKGTTRRELILSAPSLTVN
jgi:hypothetical protein